MKSYDYLHNNGDVLEMQNILLQKGYLNIEDIDGYWGPKTANAVKNLQTELKNKGLYKGNIDGAWGNLTQQALMADIGKNPKISSKQQSSFAGSSSASPVDTSNKPSVVSYTKSSKTVTIPEEVKGLSTYIINDENNKLKNFATRYNNANSWKLGQSRKKSED